MPPAQGAILVLNAGSSSLKLAVFGLQPGELQEQLRGEVQLLDEHRHLTLKNAQGEPRVARDLPAGEHDEYLQDVLDITREALGNVRLLAAGHRVVHGGAQHAGPALVSDQLLQALEDLTPLAPLHQGHNLAPIRALSRLDPGLPQVACFDTAFHLGMPDVAARFAIPRALHDAGIRRYGAHGLSYAFIAARLRTIDPELAAGRVVVAHLGSGASLCALRDGRSIDTTMGLTPLDGLVMGTRCGAIDPGVLLFLQQARGMNVQEVQELLYHRSGLLGVSAKTANMHQLLKADDAPAQQAVALFVARLAKEIAGMAVALGGIDALVFTGGIGQHAPAIRAAACEPLRFLGIAIDPAANATSSMRINPQHEKAADSRVAVLVLATDEERVIAQQTRHILGI